MDIHEIRQRADAQEQSNTGAYYQESLRALLLMYDQLVSILDDISDMCRDIEVLCTEPSLH